MFLQEICLLRPNLSLSRVIVLSMAGLDVFDVFDMTVAGLAMWKLTSADTLSSSLAIFSLERDFIRDNSDRVFFGNLDRGESCTEEVGGGSSKSGLINFSRSSFKIK